MTRRRTHPVLAQARAYWRLAAKADRAGNHRQADQFRRTGDRRYRMYRRAIESRKPRTEGTR